MRQKKKAAVAMSVLSAGLFSLPVLAESVPLKGPIDPAASAPSEMPQLRGTGVTGGRTMTGGATTSDSPQDGNRTSEFAPGEDSTVTRDMILVGPNSGKAVVGKPLGELVGTEVLMQIDRRDVVFEKLRGMMITVTNNTARPLVIDGDQGRVVVGGKEFACLPVTAIQDTIVPHHKPAREFLEILESVVPAAVTVGVVPTLRDYKISKKPVLERYGADELRRKIEYSRFGRRILWTHQKVQGIVYFDGKIPLEAGRLEVPVMTMFDNKDAAMLKTGP